MGAILCVGATCSSLAQKQVVLQWPYLGVAPIGDKQHVQQSIQIVHRAIGRIAKWTVAKSN